MSKDNFTRENYIDHRAYAYHGVAGTIRLAPTGELAYQLRAERLAPNAARILDRRPWLSPPGSVRSILQETTCRRRDHAGRGPRLFRSAPRHPDFVKLWVDDRTAREKMTPEIYQAAADEAHKLNLRVIGHVFDL